MIRRSYLVFLSINCIGLLLTVETVAASRRLGENDGTTAAPTVAPTTAPATRTKSPSATSAPTKSPSATESPTKSPSSGDTTNAPTAAPGTTAAPTPAIAPSVVTQAPTVAPTIHNSTVAPTIAPASHVTPSPSTAIPTDEPTASSPPDDDDDDNNNPNPHNHISFFRILTKTLAWLILLGLGLLAFGAIMNHRYRIYFFLRGVWYTILAQPCTQWILWKLRINNNSGNGGGGGGSNHVDGELNTIIFDNDMTSGLLLQENNNG